MDSSHWAGSFLAVFAIVFAFFWIVVLLAVGAYVLFGIFFGKILKERGNNPGFAWIPFYQYWVLMKEAKFIDHRWSLLLLGIIFAGSPGFVGSFALLAGIIVVSCSAGKLAEQYGFNSVGLGILFFFLPWLWAIIVSNKVNPPQQDTVIDTKPVVEPTPSSKTE